MNGMDSWWIESLNLKVREYQGSGLAAYDAVAQAATDFQLAVVSDGESCRIYETPDGMLVNCWLDQFVEGAAKQADPFDNQVGWYTAKS